jgi:hypothetical protein
LQPDEREGPMTYADLVTKALDTLEVEGDDPKTRSVFLLLLLM